MLPIEAERAARRGPDVQGRLPSSSPTCRSRNVMNTALRIRTILKLNRKKTASVLAKAHAISNGMAAEPKRYADPDPPLAMLDDQIATVDVAEQRAGTRARG